MPPSLLLFLSLFFLHDDRVTGVNKGSGQDPVSAPGQAVALSKHTPSSSTLPPEREKLGREEFVRELGEFLEFSTREEKFSGTVLVARHDDVIFTGAYGLASKRFSVPNRIDTKFNLGSMNKMFTAVAIMQLAEQDLLLLDDPIESYIATDWFDDLSIPERVQVRHLLTHTSGLGSYFNQDFMNSSRNLFREVDDYKPLVRADRLSFRSGTGWAYSNTGFLILGAVVEGASEQNYFEYIREFLYEPAGMDNSDCYDMDRPVPNLAIGYSRTSGEDGDGWRNNLYAHVIRGGPAGGGFSTVLDLHAFALALTQGKLVSEDSLEQLWSPKPELGSQTYGFGFGVHDGPSGRWVGHGGGFQGINSDLRIYRDTGLVVAVMSNYDHGAGLVVDWLEPRLATLAD